MNAAQIKALRQRFSASQREWGEMLGIHSLTVSRWERGAVKPRGGTLHILVALDIGTIDLGAKQLKRIWSEAQTASSGNRMYNLLKGLFG